MIINLDCNLRTSARLVTHRDVPDPEGNLRLFHFPNRHGSAYRAALATSSTSFSTVVACAVTTTGSRVFTITWLLPLFRTRRWWRAWIGGAHPSSKHLFRLMLNVGTRTW